jgi:hypothetical protein
VNIIAKQRTAKMSFFIVPLGLNVATNCGIRREAREFH